MKDNGPISSFAGVAENLRDEEALLIMYGPEWTRMSHDASEPPGDLDDLILSEEIGISDALRGDSSVLATSFAHGQRP